MSWILQGYCKLCVRSVFRRKSISMVPNTLTKQRNNVWWLEKNWCLKVILIFCVHLRINIHLFLILCACHMRIHIDRNSWMPTFSKTTLVRSLKHIYHFESIPLLSFTFLNFLVSNKYCALFFWVRATLLSTLHVFFAVLNTSLY